MKSILATSTGIWMIAVLMLLLTAGPSLADPAAGKALFDSMNCSACHITRGPVEPLPIGQRSALKGPPLWFAGSKFKAGWIAGWLAAPVPIRRVKYATLDKGANDHPTVAGGGAQDMEDYLMSLTDAELATGVVTGGALKRRRAFAAEKLFAKKQVCFGCHQYPSKRGNIGGFTGPSLVDAGARLNADWIFAQIQDPQRYYPNGRMPVYGDQAFNLFTEDELKLLSRYVGGMKGK